MKPITSSTLLPSDLIDSDVFLRINSSGTIMNASATLSPPQPSKAEGVLLGHDVSDISQLDITNADEDSPPAQTCCNITLDNGMQTDPSILELHLPQQVDKKPRLNEPVRG